MTISDLCEALLGTVIKLLVRRLDLCVLDNDDPDSASAAYIRAHLLDNC